MNKDEIKKALTCCKGGCCSYCPRWCEKGCQSRTLSDALDLITEQEKEIERLKVENDKYAELFKMKDKDFFTITVEDWEKFKSGVLAQIKQAQIDVLNKVKERAVGLAAIETYHICNLIDELIKEVQNGKDKG